MIVNITAPDSGRIELFGQQIKMVPFFAPITMLIRIVSQTPPLWEIVLSLVIGFAIVLALLGLTTRVYRVGMLMYGKRATIPEVCVGSDTREEWQKFTWRSMDKES